MAMADAAADAKAEVVDVRRLVFPVLLWRPGYIYIALNSIELATHPRSLFRETKAHAVNGEWRMADAEGKVYQLVDWQVVRPFGGFRSIGARLLLSVFAVPVARPTAPPGLEEFKRVLARAVRSRYKLDKHSPMKAILETIAKADNCAEALRAIPER